MWQTTVDLVQYSYSLSYLQMGSCQLPVASCQYGQLAACLNSHLKELANTNIFGLALLGSIKPSFIGCLGMYVTTCTCTYMYVRSKLFFQPAATPAHPALGREERSFIFLNVSIKPIKQNCRFFLLLSMGHRMGWLIKVNVWQKTDMNNTIHEAGHS